MKIAIVGATGLVGQEMKKVLAEYFRPADCEIFEFASQERKELGVRELGKSWDDLAGCEYILNASSAEVAAEIAKRMKPGQKMIDNSSGFRMDPHVPLVVPEVNGDLLKAKPAIIANPNCTAALLCVALAPLRSLGLERVTVATYQAASGAGIRGLEELDRQLSAHVQGRDIPAPEVFPFQLALNVLSHNTAIRPEAQPGGGYNDEEWKVIEESRKMLGLPKLAISSTCIRVPVRRAHTEAVTIDLHKQSSVDEIRTLWSKAAGIKIVDDREKNHFPMPLESQNQDLVLVGRLRHDPFLPQTFHFMLSGDQLRKGAATNAVQILKALVHETTT